MAEETTTCKVKTSFAHFVPGHGIVSGDPDATDGKKAEVPNSMIGLFVDRGYIVKPKDFDPEADQKKEAEAVAEAEAAARAEAEAATIKASTEAQDAEAPPV